MGTICAKNSFSPNLSNYAKEPQPFISTWEDSLEENMVRNTQTRRARFMNMLPSHKNSMQFRNQQGNSEIINLQSVNSDSFRINFFNQVYFLKAVSTSNIGKSSDITQGVPLLRRYFDVPRNSLLHLFLKETFQKYNSYIWNKTDHQIAKSESLPGRNAKLQENFAKALPCRQVLGQNYNKAGFIHAKGVKKSSGRSFLRPKFLGQFFGNEQRFTFFSSRRLLQAISEGRKAKNFGG